MAVVLKWTLVIVAAVALSLAMLGGAVFGSSKVSTDVDQSAIAWFYEDPAQIPAAGTLIRSEPLDVDVEGGKAFRVLYATTRPDGSPAVSGGMVFVPDAPAPAAGRNVIAWAHGTLGQGDSCAPSRSSSPTDNIEDWLAIMMTNGWVVTATDYAGLGTAGPNLYLIGQAEAADVVNSVRAAQQLPDAHAGNRYIVWGHSQGGHSALWTGALSEEIAPELDLVAVAAAAPAGELVDIMSAQYADAVGWAIGPEVINAWPHVYPDVPVDEVLTQAGQDNWQRLADECLVPAALEAKARAGIGEQFFAQNPTKVEQWATAAKAQTPAPLPADLPLFLGQSTADAVVLPWPNAILQERFCAAGSDVTALWIGVVGHNSTALAVGPAAAGWMTDRFDGRPTAPNCNVPPAVPAEVPAGD